MKMKKIALAFVASGIVAVSVTSCEKNHTSPDKQVEITDSISMPFRGEHYSFYNFHDGKVVPLTDSASTKWDIGINFTNIILNSHESGPGNGGVIIKYGSYEDFDQAPESGYAYDTSRTKLAIDGNPRSPNAWYIYQPTNHKVTPKAGLFFVIKTADGKYAKMEVKEITYAGWDPAVDMYPETLVFKFRYFYQPDGSRNLKN